MVETNDRNETVWVDDVRATCLEYQDLAAGTAGAAAGGATRAAMSSAGVFSAGAGLGFAIQGNVPGLVIAEGAAGTLLSPYVQIPVAVGTGSATEDFVNDHWSAICGTLADGADMTADGVLAVIQFLENATAPGYAAGKLGYDPTLDPVPTFETDTDVMNSAITTYDWSSWGFSGPDSRSAPPTPEPETILLLESATASENATSGIGAAYGSSLDSEQSTIWGGGTFDNATSPVWDAPPTHEPPIGSAFDPIAADSSKSTGWGSDNSSNPSSAWGSLYSESTDSISSGGWNSSFDGCIAFSPSQTDWSATSFSDCGSSSRHESGSGSIDSDT